jgi:predicted molibdopterin-dependent oxidoreductase YjgC
VQNNQIVRVTSPLDHSITRGNLCIKGRFGWRYVQQRAPEQVTAGEASEASDRVAAKRR